MTKLLDGEVMPDVDPEVEKLRNENRHLKRELDDAQRDAKRAKEDATRALGALRKQLGPLYRALQLVFGEIEAAGVQEDYGDPAPPSSPSGSLDSRLDPRVNAVWESWKQKLGPGTAQARIIETLQLHPSMSAAQLKVAAKMATQTVYESTSKLKLLGLIEKDSGGRWTLKKL